MKSDSHVSMFEGEDPWRKQFGRRMAIEMEIDGCGKSGWMGGKGGVVNPSSPHVSKQPTKSTQHQLQWKDRGTIPR